MNVMSDLIAWYRVNKESSWPVFLCAGICLSREMERAWASCIRSSVQLSMTRIVAACLWNQAIFTAIIMGIVHIPRTIAAIVRGITKRRLSPLSEKEKSLVGVGINNPPHIYTSRAGLFDVDLMFHMNNASYLTHAELARWEWTAFGGTLIESEKLRRHS